MNSSRREFLMRLGLGIGMAPVATAIGRPLLHGHTSLRASSLCLDSAKAVLTPSDFKYLGYYNIGTNSIESNYAQGLTHRYVNGDLRFLTFDHAGNRLMLNEFSLAGKNYGDAITVATNTWNNPFGNPRPMDGRYWGMWWDEPHARLWVVNAVDYNAIQLPVAITTHQLNADGTVSGVKGPIGLKGIPDKRVYGGVQPVPSWFQSQYGVGPYAVGWGGYTSLMAQAGGCSLGPAMYTIPDPTGYGDNSEIPPSAFKTLMDHVSGTAATDWYKSGKQPTKFDRGVRITMPTNYFDGGDPRQNPGTEPTVPPAPGAQWLSPAPDGLGRWAWGDSYFNTGMWIDGPNKTGFVAIASLGMGKVYYISSHFGFDSRAFELHVFDPAMLGEVALGNRPAWNTQPASMTPMTFNGLGSVGLGGGTVGAISGATYDSVTKRMYLAGLAIDPRNNRLYVYQVNA